MCRFFLPLLTLAFELGPVRLIGPPLGLNPERGETLPPTPVPLEAPLT